MTTTFIKTGECRKTRVPGAGEVAEIVNRALCGAQNVHGMLRWLDAIPISSTGGPRMILRALQRFHSFFFRLAVA